MRNTLFARLRAFWRIGAGTMETPGSVLEVHFAQN